MSNEKIVFNISDLQSVKLQGYVSAFDKNNDGAISEKENKKLQDGLNGNKAMQAELTDDVKQIMGLTTKSAKTEPAKITTNPTEGAATNVYDDVLAAFHKARGYDAESGKYSKTLKDAYKEVEKEFTDKKKYTKEQRKAYKEALKQLNSERKHGTLLDDAVAHARQRALGVDSNGNIVNQEAVDNNQSKKAIHEAEIEALTTKDGKVDKRAKRQLRNHNGSVVRRFVNFLSGADSFGTKMEKAHAASNRAAKIRQVGQTKGYSADEIKAKVNPELLQALIDKQIIVPNKNNKDKYDITEFSMIVGNALGADSTFNEHDVDVESECQSISDRLMLALTRKSKDGVDNAAMVEITRNLTKSDIRDLTKFLGYYDDTARNKATRVYQHAMEGLAAGAFTGAVSSIPSTYKFEDLQTQLITYDENMTNNELIELIRQGNAPDFVTTNDGILNQQLITRENVWKAIGLGAAVGAAVGAAAGVIQGLLSKGREKEVLGLPLDCDMSAQDIVNLIDNRTSKLTPEQQQAARQLVLLGFRTEDVKDPETGKVYQRFVMKKDKDGNCQPEWDYCQFLNEYNKLRGNQIFNEVELQAAMDKIKNTRVSQEDCAEEPQEVCPKPLIRQDVTLSKALEVPTTKFRAWADIVNGYDCLKAKEYQKSYKVGNGHTTLANRMVKVIQAIKVDGVKTEEELRNLYNIDTIAAFADEALRHGIDSAIAKFPELPINKAEYKTAVTSTAGIKGKVYVPALYDPKAAADGEDGFCSWNKKKPVTIIRHGNGNAGTIGDKSARTAGRTDSEKSCDNGQTWEHISNEEFDKLKEQGVTVVTR